MCKWENSWYLIIVHERLVGNSLNQSSEWLSTRDKRIGQSTEPLELVIKWGLVQTCSHLPSPVRNISPKPIKWGIRDNRKSTKAMYVVNYVKNSSKI